MHQLAGCTSQRLPALPSKKQSPCACRAFRRTVPLWARDNRYSTFHSPFGYGFTGKDSPTPPVSAPFSGPEKSKQVGIEFVFVRVGKSMRTARVDLQGRVLDQFGRGASLSL